MSLNIKWYQDILKDNFYEFSTFAKDYYNQEIKIINGIFDKNFVFQKCNRNTPYKNNIKHKLLKPIYSYNFTPNEANKLIDNIKDKKLKAYLESISKEAKNYQNSFYHIIEACYNDEKCVDDKAIKGCKNHSHSNTISLNIRTS